MLCARQFCWELSFKIAEPWKTAKSGDPHRIRIILSAFPPTEHRSRAVILHSYQPGDRPSAFRVLRPDTMSFKSLRITDTQQYPPAHTLSFWRQSRRGWCVAGGDSCAFGVSFPHHDSGSEL